MTRAFVVFVFLLLLFTPVRPKAAPGLPCPIGIAQAEHGSPSDQFKLGMCYARGQGFAQNYDEAVRWVSQAADQGFAEAQLALGPLFDEGMGVPEDHAEALKLYAKAVETARAPLNFAPPQSYRIFAGWYRDAADGGDADAQRALGLMYANGIGVVQDDEEAFFWLSLSVRKLGWNPDGATSVQATHTRVELRSRLSDSQREKIGRRLAGWKPKA